MAAPGAPPHDDSSSDDEGQAFYVGGSDHSGQQVLGPKKKKNGVSVVDRVFSNVRPHAEQAEPGRANASKRPLYFTGTGHRLGENAEESSDIYSFEPVVRNLFICVEIPAADRPPSPRDFSLLMWDNGFSIDDGPLRPYEEAENRRFLEHVERGQIPPELIQMARGGEVTVSMEDKRGETYKTAKAPLRTFVGEGRTLGSISPTTVGATAVCTEPDRKANEELAKKELKVNSTEPTTNIQLRLADGSRLVAQFNHTHTVRDVRMFVVRARPQYEIVPFLLMTSFPSQELTNEMATLSELNLLNAVIIQRVTG
ncbi:unnamed protein product [Notodromas monacha]|uniref:NSFL1 cofactor p47 n=1 Tax=Notodromas monacha TaxID=399045 RepID=A0A7R9G9M6_9CRUS|nr:unnamed protein product [Notodromas monacha]CAG0912772.1 unnamed protein product [Notodromas monacha]